MVPVLDYLSGSVLLFPAYTYDEEEITDIKASELYLFSGGQLRFYFKDIEGADITAMPVGVLYGYRGSDGCRAGSLRVKFRRYLGCRCVFLDYKNIEINKMIHN